MQMCISPGPMAHWRATPGLCWGFQRCTGLTHSQHMGQLTCAALATILEPTPGPASACLLMVRALYVVWPAVQPVGDQYHVVLIICARACYILFMSTSSTRPQPSGGLSTCHSVAFNVCYALSLKLCRRLLYHTSSST
jgi:hypothetical protein